MFIVFANNVRSLGLCGGLKIAQLLGELQHTEWDVAWLNEMRSPAGKYVLDGGHALFTAFSGDSLSGTGILLRSKHVGESNKMHAITDRVSTFEFTAYGITMRAVAVYAPYAGYPIQDFDDTFDQLRYVLQQGKHLKRRLVVGGDLNCHLDIGVRGVVLRDSPNAFGLNITNEATNQWENEWAFCSSMGNKKENRFRNGI